MPVRQSAVAKAPLLATARYGVKTSTHQMHRSTAWLVSGMPRIRHPQPPHAGGQTHANPLLYLIHPNSIPTPTKQVLRWTFTFTGSRQRLPKSNLVPALVKVVRLGSGVFLSQETPVVVRQPTYQAPPSDTLKHSHHSNTNNMAAIAGKVSFSRTPTVAREHKCIKPCQYRKPEAGFVKQAGPHSFVGKLRSVRLTSPFGADLFIRLSQAARLLLHACYRPPR